MASKRLPPHPATLVSVKVPHPGQHLLEPGLRPNTVQKMDAPVKPLWYVNRIKEATGDVRLYGILGLLLRGIRATKLTVHTEMSGFAKAFLVECGVTLDERDERGLAAAWRAVEKGGARDRRPGYGVEVPGNLFKLQYDILSRDAPVEVQLLKDLDTCVPFIRKRLRLDPSPGNTEPILIIHTKKKAFYRETEGEGGKPGVNYHEEHKLSLSLALAVGVMAADAGHTVYINDDTGKGNTENSFRNARLLCYSAGYRVRDAAWDRVKLLPKEGSLLAQYAKIGALGTTNVTHLGGRSGHLEFMIYLGQNVFYCEESRAQGEDRIFTTLCTLKHERRYLMHRILLDPTTAGGRHELELRQDRAGRRRRLNPDPSNSRMSTDIEDTTDYYKVNALVTIVRELRLKVRGKFGGKQLKGLPEFDDSLEERWLLRPSGELLLRNPPERDAPVRHPPPGRGGGRAPAPFPRGEAEERGVKRKRDW